MNRGDARRDDADYARNRANADRLMLTWAIADRVDEERAIAADLRGWWERLTA